MPTDAPFVDRLCIVGEKRRLPEANGLTTDEATVIASNGVVVGGDVRVVARTNPNARGPFYALRPGGKYLLLGVSPRFGKFIDYLEPLRYVAEHGALSPGSVFSDAPHPSDIVCLAAFETHKTALSDGANPAEVLYNSVADCLEGASPINARRVCEWLTWSYYPGIPMRHYGFTTAPDVPDGQRDFALSLRIKAIALASPPEQRAYMYLALNSWHVLGYADLYLEAIEDCANDPAAFEGLDQIPENSFYENLGRIGIPNDFRHRYSSERWAKALLGAKNPKVFRFLVWNGYVEPGSKYEPQIATMLNRKEPWVRAAIVWSLSGSRNDLVHIPKEPKGPRMGELETDFPNLPEMVAYWKKKLGVVDKP